MGTDFDGAVRYPIWSLNITSIDTSTDIHPHTSYTDGLQSVQQSIDEGRVYGLWEKGAIEHGNPLDEDIEHKTSFLNHWDHEEPFTSEKVYTAKYRNLREVMNDRDGRALLNDAELDKVRSDIQTLRDFDKGGQPTEDDLLHYKIVVPHGIELDYNPAIEFSENEQEAIDSYEEGIINFLKDAESLNSGFNYILASSHYVNTPFKPRYVKKDELFEDMDWDEKRQVLDEYRKKEVSKIESLSEKLDDMAVPRVSGELMDEEEQKELKNFIYSHPEIQKDPIYPGERKRFRDITDQELDITSPGVVVVGAHPTLIERNEELMDVFRAEEGIPTREDLKDELNDFIYDTNISGINEYVSLSDMDEAEIGDREIDEFITDEDLERIYPKMALEEYYRPFIQASENADNFMFEINGKGIERQTPSVFWSMLDQNLFGSDAHRPGESPSRVNAYSEKDLRGNTTLLVEKWLEQLDKENRDIEKMDKGAIETSERKAKV